MQQSRQRLAAAKRGRPGTGADAHAVLSHTVEIDQPLLAEYRHGVFQHPLQNIGILDAEVGQGVGVDGEAAGQPEVGVVMDAQGGQGIGTFDAGQGGVQPQGDEEAGVDGRASGDRTTGANAVIQDREVESLGEMPDGACGVIGFDQVIDKQGRKELLAVGGAEPGWEGPIGGGLPGAATSAVGRGVIVDCR